jgi:hypothetical protein
LNDQNNGDLEQTCVSYQGCGYCVDNGKCLSGNEAGPNLGACRQWLVAAPYDVITVVFVVIIIFFFLVMFFINAISALMEDWRLATIMSTEGHEGDSTLARTQWWRDERSAKAWKLWDQMQFIAYFAIINVLFSTRATQFTGYFNWANFGLPGLFEDNNNYTSSRSQGISIEGVNNTDSNATKRAIMNIDQYANAQGIPADMVFFNALIWFVVALFGSLLLYGLYFVVVIFILRKGGRFTEILMNRAFHILTRVLLAGYLPLILLAAQFIVIYYNNLGIIAAIAIILIVGFGVPAFNFMVVKGEKTDFLYYSLRIRFGAFYVSYQHTRTKFAFVVFAKKFLIGLTFGLLSTNFAAQLSGDVDGLFWAQCMVPAAIMLIYIVALVVLNPYIDLVHLILDVTLNVVNIVTLATAFLHKDQPGVGLFILMVLQVAATVFVIFSYLWTWLFYAGYTSPGQLCSGKPEDDEESSANKADDKKDANKPKAITEENLNDLEISSSDSS